MKRILVPTDFSSNANNAAKVALSLAKKSGAELHFIHVVYTPSDWNKMTDEMKEKYPESSHKVESARLSMEKLVSDKIFDTIKVAKTLGFGNPIEEINHYLSKNEVDLIVVGSHGTSHKADLFIGSNTQRIMRSTKIPVVAVKDSFKLEDLNRIVFASNFDKEAEIPFKKMEAISNALGAELDMLYINTPHNFKTSEEIDTVISKFLKEIDSNKEIHVRNDHDVAKGILSYCKKTNADMAVLINHRKAYKAHYLMGVTETLVFQSDFPVISMNVSEGRI
ncbi:universal stress protein [Fulvivirga lutea]|uniref:Universal stress protein n=1 Tax=Fulvivirga lutea TaxID=2810512 RepID=A0A975A227_9BACT|nr:universal stress protein [Fulvivirga lutea]QSE98097.1 universal stress protein [Fulvivirga lutea]